MKNMNRPLKKSSHNSYYKNPQKEQSQISQKGDFQLYLLAKPQQLKKIFMSQIPYFWVHERISKDRQFEKYLIELQNQFNIFGFPYVDNMLAAIDNIESDFKIICEAKDLPALMKYHKENKKLLAIYIFDLKLKNIKPSELKNKKIEIQSDNFPHFKRLLIRKKDDKSSYAVLTNATKISNWDLAQVNKSRLVIKTLLIGKKDEKGKQDFVKLATTVIEKQINKVYQYEKNFKINSTPEQILKQYTKKSFVHSLVNNTLKAGMGDPLLLSYIRFPVKQLYNAINSKYKQKKLYQKSFECYRGGLISQFQLQYFRQNKKGFIQMQGFVSCSKSKTQAQQFIVNCVFKIKVNNLQRQQQWDHGFVILDSAELTQFIKQQEVLFNIFSVMEIIDVETQTFGPKVVNVITLQYGSLAAQLYKKKHNLQISSHERRCVNNYEALKPYYDEILTQGDCFQFFNQFQLAQQYYQKIIKHYQRLYNSNISDTLQNNQVFYAYLHLGNVYIGLKNYEKSKEYYLKAKQYAQKPENNVISDVVKMASIYNGLGLTYKNLGQIKEAQQLYQNIIQILSKKRSAKNHLVTAYNNLAGLLVQQNQQDQALKFYGRALQISQSQNNKTTAFIFYNIGMIYFQKQNYDQAIKNFKKSIEIYNQTFGSDKQTIDTYFKLGEAYLKKNQIFNSDKSFDSVIKVAKVIYGTQLDDRYIKLKRDIQNARSKHKVVTERKNIVYSHSTHKFSDVLSFMNDKIKIDQILGLKDKQREKVSIHDNIQANPNSFNSLLVSNHINKKANYNLGMQSISLDKRGFAQDRTRVLRGQYILNSDNQENIVKNTPQIISKSSHFDDDSMMKLLANMEKKKRSIYEKN